MPTKKNKGPVKKSAARKKPAKRKAASETAANKLKILFDLLPVGVSILDRNGRVIDLNNALAEILGSSKSDIKAGRHGVGKMFDARMRELTAEQLPSARARQTGAVQRDTEIGLTTKSGDTIWTSINAAYSPELDETVIVTRDISAEKASDRERKEREEFYETMLDMLPGMVAYWDKKLICRYANAQYLEWAHLTKEQIIGSHMQDILGAELYAKNTMQIRGALAGKTQVFERKLTPIDGRFAWTSVRYVPHRTTASIEGFFVLVTDITHQVEERLTAEKASRGKSSLLAVLSQEMRTPLNGIIGTTDLLESTELTAEQAGFVSLIRKSSEFLYRHIESLLQHARLDAEKEAAAPVETDLRSLIEQLLATTRAANPKKQHLLRAPSFGIDFPDLVMIDETKTGQVLMNLVSNAVKFTTHGSITLGCKAIPVTGDNIRLILTVQDTGIGIAPQQLSRVFEPYFQSETAKNRTSGEGLGLGLSISEKLVHLMGGHIRVESEIGRGTKFTLELPARVVRRKPNGVQVPVRPATAMPVIAPQLPAKILIVDDNPLNAMLLEHMLRRLGYNPQTAENGRQAFAQATKERFDIIFMDVLMPEVNGTAATEAIRAAQNAGNPVIIAVTADASEENRTACLAAGMDDFIAKPIRLEDLTELLRTWVPRGGERRGKL